MSNKDTPPSFKDVLVRVKAMAAWTVGTLVTFDVSVPGHATTASWCVPLTESDPDRIVAAAWANASREVEHWLGNLKASEAWVGRRLVIDEQGKQVRDEQRSPGSQA